MSVHAFFWKENPRRQKISEMVAGWKEQMRLEQVRALEAHKTVVARGMVRCARHGLEYFRYNDGCRECGIEDLRELMLESSY
jgi:hypothetical protein